MSYHGHVIFMFGGALDWMARLVKITTHSSAEIEICAGCFAAKRAQFIRNLMNEYKQHGVGKGIDGPIVYLIDNSACEPLTKNVGVAKKTEHFLRWQHYLRWIVLHKYGIVLWTSTDDETGDIFTKLLPLHSHLKHKYTLLNVRQKVGDGKI